MKIFGLTLIFCVLGLISRGQSGFDEFIKLFPELKWNDLPEDITKLHNDHLINYELANENMWSDSHTDLEKKTLNLSYSTPAPHVKIENNRFIKYRGGYHGLYGEGPREGDSLLFKNTIKPLARVHIGDDIVLLILHYRFLDLDKGILDSYEAFTFRMSDEKMISAINFYDEKCFSFIEKDRMVSCFVTMDFYKESGQGDDEGYEYESECKLVYRIEDDGYFRELSFQKAEEEGNLFYGKIIDSDGWSNVREKPNVKSKTLYRATNENFVYVEKIEYSNWYRILSYFSLENSKEINRGGFIHNSRVKKVDNMQ